MSSARLAVLATAVLTFLSFCGPFSDTLELLSHWRIQILGLAILSGVFVAWRGTRKIQLAALAVCLLNAWPLAQHLSRSAPPASGSPEPTDITVLAANLHGDHVEALSFGALLDETKPDIVVLTEVTKAAETLIRSRLPGHRFAWSGDPHRLFSALIGIRGHKPELAVRDTLPEHNLPWASFHACPKACASVVAVHSPHPDGLSPFNAQSLQFSDIAVEADTIRPDILLGDLNTTPWSPHYVRLLDRTGLKDAAPGIGWVNTWLSALPGLGLRLDHILVGPKVVVRAYRVGPNIGSDHRPVIARLVVTE